MKVLHSTAFYNNHIIMCYKPYNRQRDFVKTARDRIKKLFASSKYCCIDVSIQIFTNTNITCGSVCCGK